MTTPTAPAADETGPNADQVAYWNAFAGETWASFQDRLDRQIAPLGLKAMQVLAPRPGERILDIGCGCGETSLQLAERVAPGGHVIGLDISKPMLAVARRRAAPAGGVVVDFVEADAQTYAFAPPLFDGAFSRFGVMFFNDPTAAFSNLNRALKPGGRLAFVCWRAYAENDWMAAPSAAADGLLDPAPPTDPLAPGPFTFADPERILAILRDAGFGQVSIQPHDQAIGAGDVDQSIATALRVGPLGRRLQAQPDRTEAVSAALRALYLAHLTADGVKMKSATWIVHALKI